MEFLRQLTVKQGVILLGVIIGVILLLVIVTSINKRNESLPVIVTNTPSINFDLFVPEPTSTAP